MKRALIVVIAIALASCGQTATAPNVPITAIDSDELVLACATFATLSPDALAQRFGAANITTQTLPGPEGETYEATVVFPNDPTQRLEIVWNDARTAPVSISVDSVGTAWYGPEGYTIGTSIAEIERINVMPFKLFGFGWDYGGWVSDWNVGALSQTPGCSIRIRFQPRNDTTAQGDGEFNSNDPAIRAADPFVSEFGLLFTGQ